MKSSGQKSSGKKSSGNRGPRLKGRLGRLFSSIVFLIILFPVLSGVLIAQDLYWEDPRIVVPENARFVRTAYTEDATVILWQEYTPGTGNTEQVYISVAVTEDMETWKEYRRVLGPYPSVGLQVPFVSMVMDSQRRIYIASAPSGEGVSVYRSSDFGESFQRIAALTAESVEGTTVAPRLFQRSDGGFILYSTQPFTGAVDTEITAAAESLGVTYSLSRDGVSWTPFRPLVTRQGLSYVYLPHHASWGGRDYVVFQAAPRESRFYQLYLKISDDNGASWSLPRRLTDFRETMLPGDGNPNNYDNQRPFIQADGEGIRIAWERKFTNVSPPQIYYGELRRDGTFIEIPEMVTNGTFSCKNPVLLTREGNQYLLWFDDRRGDDRIILAGRRGFSWEETEISQMPGASTFGRYSILNGELYIYWENHFQNRRRIVIAEPDRYVAPPVLRPVNFAADRASRQDRYTVTWNIPDDPSGIVGFSYMFSRDPDAMPPEDIMILRQAERRVEAPITEDGTWYIHVRAHDYAGNWSEPGRIRFERDTTPPGRISFIEPEVDERGYLLSNTATLTWEPPDDEDLAGYSYRLQFLTAASGTENIDRFPIIDPPERVMTRNESFSFRNIDNGLWALTVSALDQVGNQGESETLYIRLDRYIPVTFISNVQTQTDDLGATLLRITGRGFSVEGRISEIILDRDGREPYDYRFSLESGAYEVRTDRIIDGPLLQDIDEGDYRIGVVHPVRGTAFSPSLISISATGTVKFGDFTYLHPERIPVTATRIFTLSWNGAFFFLIMGFLLLMLVFAAFRIAGLIREGRMLKLEVMALIHNTALPSAEKKQRVQFMRKKGFGLRIKFALLVTFLVLVIVLLISLPLGRFMSITQQKNLTDGVDQSTTVLIESIAAAAVRFLPEENVIELGRLPAQIAAMEDALFVTITGYGESSADVDPDHADYLWATNDPDIDRKFLDEDAVFIRGATRIQDEISDLIPALEQEVNEKGRESVGPLTAELSRLQAEASAAATRLVRTQDQETAQLLTSLQDEITRINQEIERRLAQVGSIIGSIPDFDPEVILTAPRDYVFYRPLVYQDSGREGIYYHGMVRLGISTERIVDEILSSREALVRQTAIIAFIAVGIGIIGALILASIIIIPINRLVRGVEKIRDTTNKEELKDHVIQVKTRDEISSLADAVNQMTQGLVKAAVANKDLIMGKDVQKMFIPLEKKKKTKMSTGRLVTDHVDFFGYYEGAKGVSGDYFDYMDLGNELYAVIKCDVAGKGVSASIIMVLVATIFRSYLSDWQGREELRQQQAKAKGVKTEQAEPPIDKLVERINSMVCERSFEGKFAAFTIVLLNGKTGKAVYCHAGDKMLHYFDVEKGTVLVKELPDAPAAGVFDNDMVAMTGGFKKVPHMLKKGDTLLLFTDGVEEAQRTFRDSSFRKILCAEPGLAQGELHDTHPVGNDNEELGIGRIHQIINTFHRKERFYLLKYHNPIPNEELVFDFSGCEGTVEEMVLALTAVEKIFRLNPDPSAGLDDRVHVDKKIDQFMKKVFLQYETYFSHPLPDPKDDDHEVFGMLKEDEQYDDLTVLAIRKK